jgi:sirohydrochlorin ferrochelatase
MLNDLDRARMKADFKAIRDDRPASIAIRRGETELEAQTVRIARVGRGYRSMSGQGREMRADAIAMGDETLDVKTGDRFTNEGTLYEVVFVRPNKDEMVVAEIMAVQ